MKDIIKINQEHLDKIIHLLHNPDELMESEPALRQRLEQLAFVDAQIRKYPRLQDAAKVIMNNPDNPVRKTTAYQLIREAQYVYGSASVYEKKYWKNILIERSLQVLDHCQRYNKIKEFNMTMASLIKLFGFDRDEDQRINAELLQQHQVFVMVNFKNSPESYSMDLNKLHKMPVEERMRLIREVEAENIEFDMIKKIQKEEQEDA